MLLTPPGTDQSLRHTKSNRFILKDYYQSDRHPTPPFYRHSQTDLTEWEYNPHNENSQQQPPPTPSGRHHHNHNNQPQHAQHQQQQHQSHNSSGGSQHGGMSNGNGGPPVHRRSVGPSEREAQHSNGGGYGGGGGGRNGSAASLPNGGKDKDLDWDESGERLRRSDGRCVSLSMYSI